MSLNTVFLSQDAQTKKDPQSGSFAVQGCSVRVVSSSDGGCMLELVPESGPSELLIFSDAADLLAMGRNVLKLARRSGTNYSAQETTLLAADSSLDSVMAASAESPSSTQPTLAASSSPQPLLRPSDGPSIAGRPLSEIRSRDRAVKREGFMLLQVGSLQDMPRRFWFEIQGGFLMWFNDARDAAKVGGNQEQPSGRIALDDVEIDEQVSPVADVALAESLDSAAQAAKASLAAVPGRPASVALSSLSLADGTQWFGANVTEFLMLKRREEELVHSADSAEPIVKSKITLARTGTPHYLYLTDKAELTDWVEEIRAMAKVEGLRRANSAGGAAKKAAA